MRWSQLLFLLLLSPCHIAQGFPVSDQQITVQSYQVVSDQGKPSPSLGVYTYTVGASAPSDQGISNQEAPMCFYIQAGLHGNETLTTVFVHWLKHRMVTKQSPLLQLPPGTEIDFVPIANPNSYGSHRYNANQVNLNRNFSVLWGLSSEPAGEHAFSEPETQAIRKLFEIRNYTAAVDIHGYLPWIVGPSQPRDVPSRPSHLSQLHAAWSKTLKNLSRKLPEYHYKEAAALGDGGSFEDWAFWERSSFAFCLEMSHKARFIPSKKRRSLLDMFALYESTIFEAFQKAGELRKQLPTTQNQPLAIETETQNLEKRRSH